MSKRKRRNRTRAGNVVCALTPRRASTRRPPSRTTSSHKTSSKRAKFVRPRNFLNDLSNRAKSGRVRTSTFSLFFEKYDGKVLVGMRLMMMMMNGGGGDA